MPNPLSGLLDRLLGRGTAAVTVPPMDGALKPNHLIDAAPPGLSIAGADNLVACGERRLVSSGTAILALDADGTSPFDDGAGGRGEVLAMAATARGSLAVARADSGIAIVAGPHRGRTLGDLSGTPMRCITCLQFLDDDRLVVCEGSRVNAADHWQRDLLDNHSSGSVWLLDLKGSGKPRRLVAGLAFPYGVATASADEIVVAESWNSRLLKLRLDDGGRRTSDVVLSGIPGYPARLSPAADGHTWMTVFAPRSQLIELVRREKRFRRAMMAEVDPQYWVSAALSSGTSFREPMQGGALKQMGILKPWAPTRSYGLVVLLDRAFQPVASFHSRTGGRRHGITSVLEIEAGALLVASKGAGEVFTLDSSARAA